MYVCICNGVTEDDVRGCMAAGASTAKAVRAACGMKPGCGTCTKRLCAMVSQCRAAADLANELAGELAGEPAGAVTIGLPLQVVEVEAAA